MTFKIVRLAIYLLPVCILALLLWYDVNPSGIRYMQYTVDRPSTSISPLFPAQRLMGVEDGMQSVLQLPVYFTVHYPHAYRSVTVAVHTIPYDQELQIGLQVGSGEWNYLVHDIDERGSARFDLSAAFVQNRRLRFIITKNNLESPELNIDSIEVLFERN